MFVMPASLSSLVLLPTKKKRKEIPEEEKENGAKQATIKTTWMDGYLILTPVLYGNLSALA